MSQYLREMWNWKVNAFEWTQTKSVQLCKLQTTMLFFFKFQEAQDSMTKKQTDSIDRKDFSCKELEEKKGFFTN